MQKLLVTGAAGFIGSNFAHFWHANNPDDRIVVLDALTYAGNRHNLDGLMDQQWFSFYEGNICDLALVESLLAEHDIDTIVHFAAESHVDRSITGPDAFIETNIIGTHTLLKLPSNTGWIIQTMQNTCSIMCRPTRCMGRYPRMTQPSVKQLPMHPTLLMLPARRHRIIWCVPITILMG